MKVRYQLISHTLLTLTAETDATLHLRVAADGFTDGYLTVATRAVRLTDGKGDLALHDLEDGVYTPYLTLGGRSYPAEPIRKEGEKLEPVCREDERTKRLAFLLTEAISQIETLKKRVAALEKEVAPRPIL